MATTNSDNAADDKSQQQAAAFPQTGAAFPQGPAAFPGSQAQQAKGWSLQRIPNELGGPKPAY
jgi:hypothetical protein